METRYYCTTYHFFFGNGDNMEYCKKKKCKNIFDYEIGDFLFKSEDD